MKNPIFKGISFLGKYTRPQTSKKAHLITKCEWKAQKNLPNPTQKTTHVDVDMYLTYKCKTMFVRPFLKSQSNIISANTKCQRICPNM